MYHPSSPPHSKHHIARHIVLPSLMAMAGATATSTAQADKPTYDLSHAIVASGPAGLIATSVEVNTSVSSQGIVVYFAQGITGPGCTSCANFIYSSANQQDSGIRFQFPDTAFGVVPYPSVSGGGQISAVGMGTIHGYGSGIQSFYTQLVDPTHTDFSFVFSGHSDTAGNGVKVDLTLRALDGTNDTLFEQSALTNQAGDWQLTLNTPIGIDLMNAELNVIVSADHGTNAMSSLIVTPQIIAVPEPATWTLMGLGLIGMTWVRRQRQG